MSLSNNGKRETQLLDLLIVVLKRRRLIAINLVIVTIVAVVVSLLLSKWYTATTSILPPKQQDIFGSVSGGSSLMRNLQGVARLGGVNAKSGAYNYFAIFKSRSAMEAVIRRFDLIKVYEIADSSMEKAIRELEGNVTFEQTDDEYIRIEVLDRDPRRAADIANAFVEVLNSLSIQLGTQEARSNREFIEKRLTESKDDLRNSEERLLSFQEKTGMVMTSEESASASGVASLYALRAKKEVELAILKRGTTMDNEQTRQLSVELGELNKKLASIPEEGMESFRLYRNVVVQQKIVEFLVPLYEQARIDEQKDIPVILVLDKAHPPERKTKPKRLLLVLVWDTVCLLGTVLFIMARETFRRLQREDRYSALANEIRQMSLYRRLVRSKRREDART